MFQNSENHNGSVRNFPTLSKHQNKNLNVTHNYHTIWIIDIKEAVVVENIDSSNCGSRPIEELASDSSDAKVMMNLYLLKE